MSGYRWTLDGPLPVLEDHSRAKHDVLRAYLVNYLRILALSPRSEGIRVTLVDGFAGGGLYRGLSGELVGGSPLVLLGALQEARALVAQDRIRRGVRTPYVIDAQLHFVHPKAPIRRSRIQQLRCRASRYTGLATVSPVPARLLGARR